MSKADSQRIIKIRISYIKIILHKYLRKGALLFIVIVIIMFITKWFISIPQLLSYIRTPSLESLLLVQLSLLAMAILNISLLLVVILLYLFVGKLMRLDYFTLLDISRMLLLFSIIAAFLRAILWFLFAGAFIIMRFGVLIEVGFLLMRVESSMEMSLSFAMLLFVLFLLQKRDLIQNTAKVSTRYLVALLIVTIFSLFEVAFLVLFFILLLRKKQIVYSLAYVGIKAA